MKLTKAQATALKMVQDTGRVYAYNGISIATARALERQGLVILHHHGVYETMSYRTKRVHYIADWSVTPID